MVGDVIGGFVSDALAAIGLPISGGLSAVGTAALNRLMARRIKDAQEILVEEMKRGRMNLADVPENEMAAVAFRYMRATVEGTARLNLRLLAATASGQASGPGLYADDFLRWADLIATLRREEIVLLGAFYSFCSNDTAVEGGEPVWTRFLPKLEERHSISARDADMIGAACLRTGLMQVTGGLAAITLTGLAYRPTTRLTEFMGLADVEGVLKRHDSTGGSRRPDGGSRNG